MPDFDTRKPQEPNEPNRVRIQVAANKLRTLLIVIKNRILSMANRVRNLLIANRLRTLLIGGGTLLFVVVGVPVGLLIYSSSGLDGQRREAMGEHRSGEIALGENLTGEIAFRLDDDPWIMNADGSNLTRVSGTPSDLVELAWSPDLKKIAFTRVVEDSGPACSGGSGCYKLEPTSYSEMVVTGSETLPLRIDTSAAPTIGPAWSPDGKQIAFSRQESDTAAVCHIYVMDADDSSTVTMFATQPKSNGVCDTDPAWSPDGKQIAFASNRTGNGDIYAVNVSRADGGMNQPRRLTDSPDEDDQPSWSPDGTEIAFTRMVDADMGINTDIYKVDADGSGETRLAHHRDSEHTPTWSPDGDQIAYVRDSSFGAPAFSSAIYIMESDGSDPTVVRKFPGYPENLYWG